MVLLMVINAEVAAPAALQQTQITATRSQLKQTASPHVIAGLCLQTECLASKNHQGDLRSFRSKKKIR